jgi:hypothetical protein
MDSRRRRRLPRRTLNPREQSTPHAPQPGPEQAVSLGRLWR